MSVLALSIACAVRDQGDRDYARNFILLITGQDKSLSTNDAWRAAERAETDGIQLYVIGLNINDRVELDETSSHPLETYQYLTGSEKDLQYKFFYRDNVTW
jgi:hypothetical protein